MMPPRRRYFLLALAAFVAMFAAVARAEFRPTRYPLTPYLSLNEAPHICVPFLAALSESFFAPEFTISAIGRQWPAADVRWVFSLHQPVNDRAEFDERQRASLVPEVVDLAGDGRRQVLLFIAWTHSWRGDNYALVRFESEGALASARAKAGNIESLVRSGTLLKTPGLTSEWMFPTVIEISNEYFIVDSGNGWGDAARHALYRISPAGAPHKTCEVALLPEPDGRLGSLQGTDLTDFLSLLFDIVGGYGNCGTLNAGARLAGEAKRAVERVAWRPWSLNDAEKPPYNSRSDTDVRLDGWGHDSLWNHRIYRRLPAALSAATAALARYYSDAFGTPEAEARSEASRVLDQVLRRHFTFSRAEYPGQTARRTDRSAQLQRLLLQGASQDQIDAVLMAGAPVSVAEPVEFELARREPPLFFALEHADSVGHLLEVGADVNGENEFGKTALMYAAQFDLLEAARVLLEKGADPNRRMRAIWECSPAIEVGDRTALMYAAENASIQVIRMILDHGGDALAVDTKQRNALDYLRRNLTLTWSEREEAEALIKARSRR